MAEASIPVNLFNPGQVFACMGFLEAAEVLLGDGEGGFDWSSADDVRFRLRAQGDKNPFAEVLGFLAVAEVIELEPVGWPSGGEPAALRETIECFPSKLSSHKNNNAFPICLRGSVDALSVSHWADGARPTSFKLYSGNRSAASIARDMLSGKRDKRKKGQSEGELRTLGLSELWKQSNSMLDQDPFGALTSVGGSFNFDPRGAWTGIDAGYSPNDHKHGVAASPVVEILGAIGLEHARPHQCEARQLRYAAWGCLLRPMLARPTLAGASLAFSKRLFSFELGRSGKNKVVTFAQEETL